MKKRIICYSLSICVEAEDSIDDSDIMASLNIDIYPEISFTDERVGFMSYSLDEDRMYTGEW